MPQRRLVGCARERLDTLTSTSRWRPPSRPGAHPGALPDELLDVELKDDATPVTVADREAETAAAERSSAPSRRTASSARSTAQPTRRQPPVVPRPDRRHQVVRARRPLYACCGPRGRRSRRGGRRALPGAGARRSRPPAARVRAGTDAASRVRDTRGLEEAFVGFTDAGRFASTAASAPGRRCRRGPRTARDGPTPTDMPWSPRAARRHARPGHDAWDCGPFPVLLREAGGRFGDWDGRETIHGGEAVSCTAALWPLLEPILALRDAA
jgi:histidinol-phosphatase